MSNKHRLSAREPRLERDIYTVSRLNRELRTLVEGQLGTIWIEGELSNFARPRSGHWYFSLKDDASQSRCAMFRSRNALVEFEPREGMQVVGRARVTLYEPRGDLQLVVEQLEPAGEGLLRIKFEQLKKKLAAEGLFDRETKQELPSWPETIGVVTSPSGAALRDILTVLKRRNPTIDVIIYPASVQGANAAAEMIRAIASANARQECDVLIVGRGGGSLEDLWAFNEESLARAIFASEIPIISAVGHEIDFTIADLVADVRAPTPSASAELCSPHFEDIARRLDHLARRLLNSFDTQYKARQQQLRHLSARLQHPGRRLEQFHQRIDELLARLPNSIFNGLHIRRSKLSALSARTRACSPHQRIAHLKSRLADNHRRLHVSLQARLSQHQAHLDELCRALNAVSPEATLQRGYAILSTTDGTIARDASTLARGDHVSALLAHGQLGLTVDTIEVEDARPQGVTETSGTKD